MRGRLKLTGIVAVMLVVALGVGLAIKLMDAPANAEATDAPAGTEASDENTNQYKAGWEALQVVDEAEETVVIDGIKYGVLEDGETFGVNYSRTPTYAPDYIPALASDGTLVWEHWRDESEILPDVQSPEEAAYLAAHSPKTYQIPLYEYPGGDIYEYKNIFYGGPEMVAVDLRYAESLIIKKKDGSTVEIPYAEYEENPGILDEIDGISLDVRCSYPDDYDPDRGVWH